MTTFQISTKTLKTIDRILGPACPRKARYGSQVWWGRWWLRHQEGAVMFRATDLETTIQVAIDVEGNTTVPYEVILDAEAVRGILKVKGPVCRFTISDDRATCTLEISGVAQTAPLLPVDEYPVQSSEIVQGSTRTVNLSDFLQACGRTMSCWNPQGDTSWRGTQGIRIGALQEGHGVVMTTGTVLCAMPIRGLDGFDALICTGPIRALEEAARLVTNDALVLTRQLTALQDPTGANIRFTVGGQDVAVAIESRVLADQFPTTAQWSQLVPRSPNWVFSTARAPLLALAKTAQKIAEPSNHGYHMMQFRATDQGIMVTFRTPEGPVVTTLQGTLAGRPIPLSMAARNIQAILEVYDHKDVTFKARVIDQDEQVRTALVVDPDCPGTILAMPIIDESIEKPKPQEVDEHGQ